MEVQISLETHARLTCRVIPEDGEAHERNVTSLSMRAAQREMTGKLIDEGWWPRGSWWAKSVTPAVTARFFDKAT